MVKALFLGLLAATMCGLASAAPAPQIAQRTRGGGGGRDAQPPSPTAPADEDPVARSERSTNLSHITGTARKIQMFIKNRHLQLLPDGIVNGTTDDTSPYSECLKDTSSLHALPPKSYVCQSRRPPPEPRSLPGENPTGSRGLRYPEFSGIAPTAYARISLRQCRVSSRLGLLEAGAKIA